MLSLRPALIRPLTSLSRQASTLVLAEHDNANLSPVTLHAITAANTIGGDITCLVAGSKCGEVAKEVAGWILLLRSEICLLTDRSRLAAV